MNLFKREYTLLRALQNSINVKCYFNQKKIKIDNEVVLNLEKEFKKVSKNNRTKATFLTAIELFRNSRGSRGRGHVEFINVALKNLKDYGLHKDLDTYKALLNIFPKGIMIPQNIFQKMFLHYPLQQVCCVHLLDQMEWHGVQIDKEVHDIVVNTFGEWTYAGKKAKRMMYWMPKLKHTNCYLDRRLVENKNLTQIELAQLALKMISKDSGAILTNINISNSNVNPIFGNWIVSSQSPLQQKIIKEMSTSVCYNVEGPYFVYVMNNRLEYCTLTSKSQIGKDEEFIDQRTFHDYENLHEKLFNLNNKYNIHQQSDQTILALCIMEENTQQMASAWLNHLQKKNTNLKNANILIKILDKSKEIDNFEKNR